MASEQQHISSMPNSHKVDQHFDYLSQSNNSGHFLPSLPNQHSPNQQPARQVLLSSSLPPSSHFTMVHSDDADKKRDRKSMARRQLVETLSAGQHAQGVKGLRRTQSCNYSTQPNVSQSNASMSRQYSHQRDCAKEPRHYGKPLWVRQNTLTSHNISAEKTRQAIENWNDLVLELHSEQYRQQLESQRHLEVLSDTSSDGHVSSPIRDHGPAHNGHSTPRNKREASIVHITDAKYPSGLGFTKYRPITPNLLVRLEKQKLPSRKRTQMWVNQLPDQRRSYLLTALPETHITEESEHYNHSYSAYRAKGIKDRTLHKSSNKNH